MSVRVAETQNVTACQAMRRSVFINEQGVAEADEVDGKDGDAVHLLASLNGYPVGAARVLPMGTTAKIGRVCVLRDHRGKGIGEAIIQECHSSARRLGATRAILGAQLSALSFYERLGYRAYGAVFDDAGIDHRMMEISL
ncbi:MAG: GNAT family N-acetyltransferase [Rhodobacteraceae bacterium]|nr:GNAT family N-acetyltransferase [Paracoccaceae bacterium]